MLWFVQCICSTWCLFSFVSLFVFCSTYVFLRCCACLKRLLWRISDSLFIPWYACTETIVSTKLIHFYLYELHGMTARLYADKSNFSLLEITGSLFSLERILISMPLEIQYCPQSSESHTLQDQFLFLFSSLSWKESCLRYGCLEGWNESLLGSLLASSSWYPKVFEIGCFSYES